MLALTDQSHFYSILKVSTLGLIISLAISKAELIGKEIAIGLSK